VPIIVNGKLDPKLAFAHMGYLGMTRACKAYGDTGVARTVRDDAGATLPRPAQMPAGRGRGIGIVAQASRVFRAIVASRGLDTL
jgi:hypothetical protein